jgi:hypothetical protein
MRAQVFSSNFVRQGWGKSPSVRRVEMSARLLPALSDAKNPKKSERFPSLVRILYGDRQNASCRVESMGAVRLAITTIVGLTDLFCMELLSEFAGSRALSV